MLLFTGGSYILYAFPDVHENFCQIWQSGVVRFSRAGIGCHYTRHVANPCLLTFTRYPCSEACTVFAG